MNKEFTSNGGINPETFEESKKVLKVSLGFHVFKVDQFQIANNGVPKKFSKKLFINYKGVSRNNLMEERNWDLGFYMGNPF